MVQEEVEVEVKRIFVEMVKPWFPTPSHLKTKRLSILDQLATPFHVPTLLFYSQLPSSFPLTVFKTSLEKALSPFYPLAGRFLDDSTLICDDQGALLIHTQVASTLQSYHSLILTNSDHKSLLDNLLPPRDLLHGSHQHRPIPISAWLQLAFQVNLFQCGGVVIGCYMSHKVMDGISAATFLRHWAGLTFSLNSNHPSQYSNQQQLMQVPPNFDAIVTTFPPYKLRDDQQQLGGDALQVTTPTTTTATVKAFVFKPAAISCIRDKASSQRIPNPSRIESVVGFLWKHCLEAETKAGPTSLVLTVDMRSRACPPLPRESMGNLATNVVARADHQDKGIRLGDLVVNIRGAINEFEDEKMTIFQGEKGGDALWEHRKMINQQSSSNSTASTYIVSCQCRAGFTDLDFGFGKPYWIYPFVGVIPSMHKHSFIILVDHIDPTASKEEKNNGIEAWLILDKKQMQCLDTNPDFLVFASPLVTPILDTC